MQVYFGILHLLTISSLFQYLVFCILVSFLSLFTHIHLVLRVGLFFIFVILFMILVYFYLYPVVCWIFQAPGNYTSLYTWHSFKCLMVKFIYINLHQHIYIYIYNTSQSINFICYFLVGSWLLLVLKNADVKNQIFFCVFYWPKCLNNKNDSNDYKTSYSCVKAMNYCSYFRRFVMHGQCYLCQLWTKTFFGL